MGGDAVSAVRPGIKNTKRGGIVCSDLEPTHGA